jgi:hypothetical protein
MQADIRQIVIEFQRELEVPLPLWKDIADADADKLLQTMLTKLRQLYGNQNWMRVSLLNTAARKKYNEERDKKSGKKTGRKRSAPNPEADMETDQSIVIDGEPSFDLSQVQVPVPVARVAPAVQQHPIGPDRGVSGGINPAVTVERPQQRPNPTASASASSGRTNRSVAKDRAQEQPSRTAHASPVSGRSNRRVAQSHPDPSSHVAGSGVREASTTNVRPTRQPSNPAASTPAVQGENTTVPARSFYPASAPPKRAKTKQ